MTPEEIGLLDELFAAGLYDNPRKKPSVSPVGMSSEEYAIFEPLGNLLHAILTGDDVQSPRQRLVEAIEATEQFVFMPPEFYLEALGLLEDIAVELKVTNP